MNDAYKAIAELDLEPIKVKLMHKESGEGWSLERANAVEFEYRRFLILMKKYPDEQTAPLVDVDTFWHYHILDTLKYAVDCEAVFGYFLHHFPYIGLRGEADEEAHQRVGQRMKELYEETFGEDYIRPTAGNDAAYSGIATAAFSGIVTQGQSEAGSAQTAFSGMATNTAFSGIAAKTAFSGMTTQAGAGQASQPTAFSGIVAQGDARQAGAQTAFSGMTTKTAFSGMTTKTAFSGMTTKTAFSGMTTQAQAGHADGQTAFSGIVNAQQDVAAFYTVRPRLAVPA